MTIINLREFYPWYIEDQFIEVTDEVAEALNERMLYEAAHYRRVVRNRAQYSLDCDDGIEYSVCQHEPSPQELVERLELFCALCHALNSLPETQGHRVDAHIILGLSYREIAVAEGVDKRVVRRSVLKGLRQMKKYLQKNL
ncbi:MAG: sigma-70 family RNA polymerase sigma factor [Clostridia bacterium]|nr:sigma-70 family RNA polymerase sigma factor [Clostridia bacterium]